MRNLLTVKTATITSKGQIAIPHMVRRREGFSVGSKIAILSFADHIEIRPMEQLERLYPALMSENALKDGWSGREEDRAWKDL